jgi:hypothetical protein
MREKKRKENNEREKRKKNNERDKETRLSCTSSLVGVDH